MAGSNPEVRRICELHDGPCGTHCKINSLRNHQSRNILTFEVLAAVLLKMKCFWNATLYQLVNFTDVSEESTVFILRAKQCFDRLTLKTLPLPSMRR